MQENKDELNLIRIGTGTRVNGVLRFANVLLKERNFREIRFRALGASIGKLVSSVELLKITHPGMYQVNTIGTVSFQLKDSDDQISNQRLYPKLEIVLSLDEPKNKGEGYQEKMSEEERLKLCKVMERNVGSFGSGGRASRGGRGFGGGRFRPGNRGNFRGGRPIGFNMYGNVTRGRGGYGARGRGIERGYSRGRIGRGFGGNQRNFRGRGEY